MACDLITEMAFIIVVSATDKQRRAREMQRRVPAIGLASFVIILCTGILPIKRIVYLMSTSYSEAYMYNRSSDRIEKHSMREGLLNSRIPRISSTSQIKFRELL